MVKSVWSNNARPKKVEQKKQKKKHRDLKDRNALIFSLKHLEILSNHVLNQSFGNLYNHIKNKAPEHSYPDLLMLTTFGHTRSIKDAVFNVIDDICIKKMGVRKSIDALYAGVPFAQFHVSEKDRRKTTQNITLFKKQYKEHLPTPTLTTDLDFINICALEILSSMKNACQKNGVLHEYQYHMLQDLIITYTNMARELDRGKPIDELLTPPTYNTGIDFIDNGYNTIETVLQKQIAILSTAEMSAKFNMQANELSILGILSGHNMDLFHTLQDYRKSGLWIDCFESTCVSILHQMNQTLDTSNLANEDFPNINEMVGITKFMMNFQQESLAYYPQIYTGIIKQASDDVLQATLNHCAQTLNHPKTQTIRMSI